MDLFLEVSTPEDLCKHLFLSFVRLPQPANIDGKTLKVWQLSSKRLLAKNTARPLQKDTSSPLLLHKNRGEITALLLEKSKIVHTGAKIHILSKNHILKIPLFTKYTFLKLHFSQNSHFWNLIFHKIHIFEISFFTKFTFLKYQSQGNFWIKSVFLPHCAIEDVITRF